MHTPETDVNQTPDPTAPAEDATPSPTDANPTPAADDAAGETKPAEAAPSGDASASDTPGDTAGLPLSERRKAMTDTVPTPDESPAETGTPQTPTANPTPDPQATTEQDVDAEVEKELADTDINAMMEASLSPNEVTPEDSDDADSSGSESKPAQSRPAKESYELRRGRIARIAGDDVFIDLHGEVGKMQGVVPVAQFDRAPRVGSIMDFVVEKVDEAAGLIQLSREGVAGKAVWETMDKGATVEGRVTGTNKGGLELEVAGNIKAFMPASQVDINHVDDLEPLIGQKIKAIVQEVDRRGKKVVLSRRVLLEKERKRLADQLWSSLEVGQMREGKVVRLMDFGAFVDLGGADGLIHVSDLSHTHINKPSEVVKVGDTVQVMVLKIDKDKDRIGLGLKQAKPDPWQGIEARYTVGDEVTGRIVKTADFGAFVQVEEGVEGLLPISELSWSRVNKTSDVVKEGDTLKVSVLSVEPDRKRMSFSLKQAQGDPWVGASSKYPVGEQVQGTVKSTTDFGEFVELETGIEGLVHISELADRRVGQVTDEVQTGQSYTFRVLECDEENRKIKLSKRSPREERLDPAEAKRRAADQKRRAHQKIDKKNLRGGMDLGSMGLGDLKL